MATATNADRATPTDAAAISEGFVASDPGEQPRPPRGRPTPRIPLRITLVGLMVLLVAVGLGATGVAATSLLRNYLTEQQDAALTYELRSAQQHPDIFQACLQGLSQRAPNGTYYSVAGTGDPEGKLPDRVFLNGEELAFLNELDFLILAMPLTPTTEGIIGERELRALPHSAFLLNPSRGPLIQEQALLNALNNGWIAGAAIDTHYHYPLPPEHPLWRFPNVILTPHISGSGQSPHFLERTWDIFVENVARLIDRRPLLNQLSEAQLSGA